ncbi:MAG: monomeric [FeFe] hydrogenase [Spirochaetia bacterium]|nr:monomeric [FeFe] hydrogenase [Spirochaetia bacterium]
MLTQKNQYTYLRRELASKLLKLYRSGSLLEKIDRIPVDMIPKDQAYSRCCIYKDRAMIRSRLLSLMGVDLEQDDDEVSLLSTCAGRALQEPIAPLPVLTVISTGCSSCMTSQYRVTELCRGCLARPCMTNCPKDAITFVGNRAFIDTERCVNCGKCRDVCPFNAILYIPVPCEDVCPVGAIRKDLAGQVSIDRAACIDCGRCARACPFGAIVERSQILTVAGKLTGPDHVTALVAPSVDGQFPGTLSQILASISSLGFDSVIEVAEGAGKTVEAESKELVERMAQGEPFMTTSCCSAYLSCVRKHIPQLKDRVSHTRSPMSYAAEAARARRGDTFTVFIGPCIAKKQEGAADPHVDAVITFEELAACFLAWDIDVRETEELPGEPEQLPRGFAVAGGVARSVAAALPPALKIRTEQIEGLTKKNIALMKSWGTRPVDADLVEVMCCEDGCIGGPGCIVDARLSKRRF